MSDTAFLNRSVAINRRVLAGWLYMAVTSLSGLVMILVLGRSLDLWAAAKWYTMQSLAGFASLSELGSSYSLMREVAGGFGRRKASGFAEKPVYYSASDQTVIHSLLERILPLNIIVVSILAMYFILNRNGNESLPRAILVWFVFSSASAWPILFFADFALLEGCGRLDLLRYIQAAGHLITTLIVCFLAYFTQSMFLMSFAFSIGTLCTCVAVRRTNRARSQYVSHRLIDGDVSAILSAGYGVAWINLGALATRSAYIPLVNMWVGSLAVLGLFGAQKIFGIISAAVNILIVSERALIAQQSGAGDHESLRARLIQIVVVNLCSAAFLGFFGLIAGYLCFKYHLIKGDISVENLVVLYVDLVIGTVTTACGQFVMATGRNPFRWSVLISGVLTTFLCLILIPFFGTTGAILAPLLAGLTTSYWFNVYWAIRIVSSGVEGPPVSPPP